MTGPKTPWQVIFDVAFDIDPADEPGGGDWTNLSSRVRGDEATNITSGSGRLGGGAEGSASLTLDNTDRGIDPTNSSATYNLVPLRHARIRATLGGTTYPLFRGYVDAWPPSWERFTSLVRTRLVDGFAWLGLQDADIDRPREFSHERIEALLDLAGWPAGRRDIGDGRVELEPYVQASGNLLQVLRDTADAEIGDLWVAPDGDITFRSRHNNFGATPSMTFGEGGTPFSSISPVWDAARLTNTARAELEDGDVFEKVDATSVDSYGPRVMALRDLALRPAEAEAAAMWEVDRFSEPRLWLDAMTVHSAQSGALAVALGVDVCDLVSVVYDPPSGATVDKDVVVTRVSHSITDVAWMVTFDLAPWFGEGPWLTLDHVSLGLLGANKLAP